ncbi:MAG: 4Fe-4S dicluster domain-containing protein [Candidatus Geothermincolia bacterium]
MKSQQNAAGAPSDSGSEVAAAPSRAAAPEGGAPLTIPAGDVARKFATAGFEIDINHCYGCARCSSICKAALYSSRTEQATPRSLIYQVTLGLQDEAIAGEFITLCSGCGRCVERCPQGVDIPGLVATLRHAAAESGRPNRFAARVNDRICMRCGSCVQACPMGAVEVVETGIGRAVRVDTAECRGCGSCSAACPNGAIQQSVSSHMEILERLRCNAK